MRRIDIRYLRRRGWLHSGHRGALSWSAADELIGSISYRVHETSLELVYRMLGEDEVWREVQEHVPFSHTAQRLGGTRRWFLCPRCRRRCAVLYGGSYFRCRVCHRLGYQIQHESSAHWRAVAKARKLRRRLGGSGDLEDPFPDKPKGMHWRTYERLCRRAEWIEDRAAVLEADDLVRLIGRLGIGAKPK